MREQLQKAWIKNITELSFKIIEMRKENVNEDFIELWKRTLRSLIKAYKKQFLD